MSSGTESELERVESVLHFVLEEKWEVKLQKWDVSWKHHVDTEMGNRTLRRNLGSRDKNERLTSPVWGGSVIWPSSYKIKVPG